jgi:putative spermidine/putrescine transport system substrate-binding protein
MTTLAIGRRKVLRAGLGAVAATAAPRFAAANDDGPLAAQAFPGITEELARTVIAPAFRQATAKSVNIVPGLAVDAIAKISASPASPPLDVIILDDPTGLVAVSRGLVQTIPADKVPNGQDVPAKMHLNRGITQTFQLIGLMYNAQRVQPAPTSWDDLWNPKFKGRVAIIGPDSSLGLAWMVNIAKARGGSEDDLEPAWKALRDLVPNIATIPRAPGSLVALMEQGQIDIAVGYLSIVQPLRMRGSDVMLAKPSQGWSVVLNVAHIVTNSPNPGLAAAYINAMMDPAVQTKLAGPPAFQFPTNAKVPYQGEIKNYVNSQDELLTMITTDWAKINPQRSAIIDRFNRDVRKG